VSLNIQHFTFEVILLHIIERFHPRKLVPKQQNNKTKILDRFTDKCLSKRILSQPRIRQLYIRPTKWASSAVWRFLYQV